MSTKFVLRNIIRLKTRSIYKVIDNQNSWDSHLNILNYPEAHKDILFWRDNINDLNKRNIIENTFSSITSFSDASSTGIGAICESNNLVCHKNFNLEERNKSSTWRELEAIRFSLKAFSKSIQNNSIKWLTDNKAAMFITKTGSRKNELQKLSLEIFNLTKTLNINLDVQWIQRDSNKAADYLSKIVDPDDWELTDSFFKYLEKMWGPFTIDRFANHNNAKVTRFNSKYFVPGTEAIDAFTQDWSLENNLLVPPTKLILRTIRYIENSKVKGVLVVPYWPASSFWSKLQINEQFSYFIQESFISFDTRNILKQGNFKESLLGSENYKGGIAAFKIRS